VFSNQYSIARRTPADVIAGIRSRCTITEKGCWEYPCKNGRGYGSVTYRRKRWMVHRFVYWHVIGQFDLSLEILHRCDNPPCCNPDHLVPGTHHENLTDCLKKGRHGQLAKTHCKHGHEFTPENTRLYRSARTCIACERARHLSGKYKRGGGRHLKTICAYGHPLEGENLYVTSEGRRRCRACHLRHVREAYERRLAQITGSSITPGTTP
jgi:hypothetical protein